MIPSEAATIVDNCPEVENYWGPKYNEKMEKNKKMLSFFVFLLKMITTTNYNSQKISLGLVQNKKSRNAKKYQNIPILYDGRRNALVHLCGRFLLIPDLSFDSSFDNYIFADASAEVTVDNSVDFSDKYLSNSDSLAIEVDADNRKLFEGFEKKLQDEVGEKVKLIEKKMTEFILKFI